MRKSTNQYKAGQLQNGYDYDLQCWVVNGLVVRCGHLESMKCTCNGRIYEGTKITQARAELGL